MKKSDFKKLIKKCIKELNEDDYSHPNADRVKLLKQFLFKSGDKIKVVNISKTDKDYKRLIGKIGRVVRVDQGAIICDLKGFSSHEIDFHPWEIEKIN